MNYKGALEVLHKIGGQDLVDAVEKEIKRQGLSATKAGYSSSFFPRMFDWETSELGNEFWTDIDHKFLREACNELRFSVRGIT